MHGTDGIDQALRDQPAIGLAHLGPGRDSSNQRKRDRRRAVMPLTLKVAIFMIRLRKASFGGNSKRGSL
jgi:hypothetical protein